MSKIKTIIVVVLLVAAGGAGALFGLNSLYLAQIQDQVESRLGGADSGLVDFLRVKAFLKIQNLSRASEEAGLLAPLSRIPSYTADLSPEALINALKGPHDDLVPVLSALEKKTKVGHLAVLSSKGRVVAKLVDPDKYGESLKGLPIVEECLGGISRDGFYELDKGKPPYALAAAPIRNRRGDVAGCLLSMEVLGPATLEEYSKETGFQAALFLRKQVVVSTVSARVLKPLASRLGSKETVRFPDPEAPVPLLVSAGDLGFAARSVRLPSGTDGLHAAVVIPLADLAKPLAKAQQTLFIGVGALLILGLLIGLLLAGKPAPDKQAQRLCDAVGLVANGSASTLNVESYSGVYQNLAGEITKLVTGGTRPPAAVAPESVSDILGKPAEPSPEEAGAAGTLDFESLLGGDRSPARAEPPPPPEPEPAAPPQPPPEEEAPELDVPTVAAPPPFFPPKEKPAPKPPPAGAGPRVSVPSDLAGIFDDQAATREVEPSVPAKARPEFPVPLDSASAVPDLDAGDDEEQITSSDYKPDATVIAQVPDELLKLSGSGEEPAPAKPSAMPRLPVQPIPPPPAPPSQPPQPKPAGEEAHFKEVFDQFVSTKKQCGESTAGLTFDRFAQKLRKNTSDLKARYKCRTVKFQVYTKNGKAALKATPVK